MITKAIRTATLGVALLATMATCAMAAPVTLNFKFANGGATAVGSITFETTLISNPGNNVIALPNPAVLALDVTVSGASAGNGTFSIGSFTQVEFFTSGATLDLTQSLIGQSTPGGPWGPVGGGGLFVFSSSGPPAPTAADPFIIAANGGAATSMTLTQMGPAGAPPPPGASVSIPTLDEWKLVLLALLVGAGGILLIGRKGSPRKSG